MPYHVSGFIDTGQQVKGGGTFHDKQGESYCWENHRDAQEKVVELQTYTFSKGSNHFLVAIFSKENIQLTFHYEILTTWEHWQSKPLALSCVGQGAHICVSVWPTWTSRLEAATHSPLKTKRNGRLGNSRTNHILSCASFLSYITN